MNYHLLDDDHIEILAGDIARGLWNFASENISRQGEENVVLKHNTRSLQVRLRREVGRLDTISELPVSSLAGVAFTLMWGTLGGLAGAAAGMVAGKQEFICIGCQLNDGRKFIATMRASVFSRWCKACPDAKKIDKKK